MNTTFIAILGSYRNPDVARLKCDSYPRGQNTCQHKLKDKKLGKSLTPHISKAGRKGKDSCVDCEEDIKSLLSERGTKKYLSGVSKVEVSLVNADLWKELCEIGNEMKINCTTQYVN